MATRSPTFQKYPLKMVGGSNFGRYPKISVEETWNMIISDNFLVPFAGHQTVCHISPNGEGRGIYGCQKINKVVLVVDRDVMLVDINTSVEPNNNNFPFNRIGQLDSDSGTVTIAENNNSQVCICDSQFLYIFNYTANTFEKVTFGDPDDAFIPSYVAFQNGQFVAGVLDQPTWRLSAFNDGTSWPNDSNHVGEFQTKPDSVLATVPIPGQSGLLYVFGKTVIEPWVYTGQQLFPYQKNTYFDIDYGTTNAATIATLQNLTVWLAVNEKTGPMIVYSNGGVPQKISTDGIDFKLSQVVHPEEAFGFLFRQDGHLIYLITFPNELDNFSLIYDFNTSKFFNVCNENQGAHIAKKVIYFNNAYFFISTVDGNLYEISSNYVTYDGAEIPRMRITPTFRLPDNSAFVANSITCVTEQGESDEEQRVDVSLSIDGGATFGNFDGMQLYPLGKRINRFINWGLGWGNEFTFQFRFWGKTRFVLSDGEVDIYQ